MKTVVLGTGRMGRRHIQVVREAGLELVGICDNNSEALALTRTELGISNELHYQDARALLEQRRPECVIVATTAPTHAEYTCLAAEHGAKYILCEKPMATSLTECDLMIEACRKFNVRLAINHQMRFMEQYTAPKLQLMSEKLGGLSSITVVAGNFGIAMNGSHYFEMFHYMMDEAPKYVSAWFSDKKVLNPRGSQFEDRAGAVRIISGSQRRFYMEASFDQGHGVQVIYAAQFGQIIVDELSGKMRMTYREDQYRDLPTTRYGMPGVTIESDIKPADATAPSRAVLEALINEKNFPTGEDGRLAIATLVGAYVSNENEHASVNIDDLTTYHNRAFPWA